MMSIDLIASPQSERENSTGAGSSDTQKPKCAEARQARPAASDATVMVVDDEPLSIELMQEYLRADGYRHIVGIDSPAVALWSIISKQPDVLLLDVHMPQIDGLTILQEVRRDERLARMPVIIMTAETDHATKLQALEFGATDFLQKPIHSGELCARLRNILWAKAYQDHLRDSSLVLEQAVRRRTAELEASRMEVIHCLARAAEYRDDDTGHHVLRVGRYARLIGEQLGLSDKFLELLEPAAKLHDIGKIGIPDEILHKPGKLTPEEFERMQKHCNFGKHVIQSHPANEGIQLRAHTQIGAHILDNGRSPLLAMAMRVAMTHHERWDGSGYPLGLAGEDIPIEGRITAVADVFDALSSKRPYKPAFPIDKCFAIMEEGRGTQFDPKVLDAFLECRNEIIFLQIDLADHS